MTMLSKIGRLFTIKTRLEAYLITYAIAVGAMERGQHYLQAYPGTFGTILAVACAGVPFLAGAKLLDAVRPAPVPSIAIPTAPRRRPTISRNRPRFRRTGSAAGSRRSLRKD